MLSDTRKKARTGQQREGRLDEEEQNSEGNGASSVRALTVVHLQGAIMLLLLCLTAATLTFAIEFVLQNSEKKGKTSSN